MIHEAHIAKEKSQLNPKAYRKAENWIDYFPIRPSISPELTGQRGIGSIRIREPLRGLNFGLATFFLSVQIEKGNLL